MSTSDDLREAARYMRATLCYGGSADPFYRTIAEWWDREAGQAERCVTPGFPGVADELAVRSARAYLPGARAWLHEPTQTTASGANAGQESHPGGTDEVPNKAKDCAPTPTGDASCSAGGSTSGGC